MKYIYLDVTGIRHSLYNELINHPPNGYEFIRIFTSVDSTYDQIFKFKKIYELSQNIPNKICPLNLLKAYSEKFKTIPRQTDITYSTGHIVFRKEPWITDLENVSQFAGWNLKHFKNYKKIIAKQLTSDNCKKIIPWTEAGKKTILLNLDCSKFIGKIETVHLAVFTKNFVKKFDITGIKMLIK